MSYPQIKCQEHQGEYITNFCCDLKDLKPLCPECIYNFTREYFEKHGTYPKIDSIKNVTNGCRKKIMGAINQLKHEEGILDIYSKENPETVVDQGIKLIDQNEKELLKLINQFYNNIKDVYRKKISQTKIKGNEIDRIYRGMAQFENDLNKLKDQLDIKNSRGNQLIQTIQTVCLLDAKSYLDQQKNEINNLVQGRNSNPVDIVIDESKLYTINENLSKYINLSYNPQRQYGNEKVRSRKSIFSQNFDVGLPDYFNPSAYAKCLHFFQNDEKIIHLLDLNSQRWQFKAQKLNINFNIPHFHKSIITRLGQIFLSGGSDPNNQHRKLNNFYLYNYKKKTLDIKDNMLSPRSSHCLCYFQQCIYAIGGIANKSQFTQTCEKYNIQYNKWQKIANLNKNAVASSCTNFNDRYIFKFGGVLSQEKLNNYIEMYDPQKDKWDLVDANINENPQKLMQQNFRFLSTSACCQINKNQILIFGGYDEQNHSSSQSFLLEVNEDDNDPENRYLITCINQKPLPYAEAFWDNNPIIYSGTLLSLQNISNEYQNNVCYEGKRRVLSFNSHEWKALNQIEFS